MPGCVAPALPYLATAATAAAAAVAFSTCSPYCAGIFYIWQEVRPVVREKTKCIFRPTGGVSVQWGGFFCCCFFFGARREHRLPNVMLSPACLPTPRIPASASDPRCCRSGEKGAKVKEIRRLELFNCSDKQSLNDNKE